MTDSAVAEHAAPDHLSRRALLGAGVVGAALAMAVSRPADAAAPMSDEDLGLASFAISLELAARDLYQAAIDAGASGTAWELLTTQHASYAQRLAGLTGISANTRDDAVYDALSTGFTGDRPANAAFGLENTAAATHAELVALVTDTRIAEVMAAIAAMESRHAAYLAERSGRGSDFDALFRNAASPVTPGASA